MSLRRYFALGGQSTSVSSVARAGILAALLCSGPAVASAQDGSHWLVGASFSPKWSGNEDLSKTVGWDGELEGSEFTIGVGRGSTFGGDWTISFVHKPIEDGTSVEVDEGCSSGSCYRTTEITERRDVVLRGMEFLWSGTFVTIAERVQVGVNVGGGFAKARGTVVETIDFFDSFTFPGSNRVETFTDSFSEERPAKEVFYSTVPLFKVEAQVGVIVAPSFKIRVSGGLNNPGDGVRVSAVYLIGA
jgi:hypothetical protein